MKHLLDTKFLETITLDKALKMQDADRAKAAAQRADKGLPPKVSAAAAKRAAAGLPPKPEDRSRVDITCTLHPCLSIRITARADRKVWTHTYLSPADGEQKRDTLGVFGKEENGAVSVAIARGKALATRESVHNNVDPEAIKAASKPGRTFGQVMQQRLDVQVMGLCKEDEKIALRYKTKFKDLLALPIKDFKIDPHYNDLIKANEDAKQHRALEKIRSDLSCIFKFAKNKQYVDINPIPDRAKRKGRGSKSSNRRARALSPQEIVKVWRALEEGALPEHITIIVQLMILLGQRGCEIVGMRDSEIVENSETDWVWTIPGDVRDPETDLLISKGRTKNGKFHKVPLCPLARKLVTRAREFANGNDEFFLTVYKGRIKSTLRADVGAAIYFARNCLAVDPFGIGDWTLHMLRHTVITGMKALKVAGGVRSLVVNHAVDADEDEQGSDWAESAVTAGYTHDTDEIVSLELQAKREALDLWGQKVAELVGEAVSPAQLKLVA